MAETGKVATLPRPFLQANFQRNGYEPSMKGFEPSFSSTVVVFGFADCIAAQANTPLSLHLDRK
jgi:hypothetical protein